MRDDKVELALIEDLVSLIAERTTITVTGIERKRNAPDKPYEMTFGRRGKESTDEIRRIVATLDAREQDELAQVRQTLAKDARRGARRPLRHGWRDAAARDLPLPRRAASAIVHPGAACRARREGRSRSCGSPAPERARCRVGTLLRDALLRARLAAASASADPSRASTGARSSTPSKHALEAHSTAEEHDPAQPEPPSVVDAMTALGRSLLDSRRV